MLTLIRLLSYFTLLFLILSCSNDDNSLTENETQFAQKIISSTSLYKYELLSTAPIHTQTSMLTKYQNQLYRFGSRSPVQIFDLNSKTWSQVQIPDSSYWRWDGALVTIGEMIYQVAVSTDSESYDILKFNPANNSFEHTNVNLPNNFHYPAYCTNDDKIVFLYKGANLTYEYNPKNNLIRVTANNPFYATNDYNLNLSSGRFNNYFYVFGGYSDSPNNLFYRLDLNSYEWEKLKIPEEISTKLVFGSVFGEQLVLFSDTLSTFEYSFLDDKWYEDTTRVPIYPRGLSGDIYNGEWSFYSDGSTLYATTISDESVWKITK